MARTTSSSSPTGCRAPGPGPGSRRGHGRDGFGTVLRLHTVRSRPHHFRRGRTTSPKRAGLLRHAAIEAPKRLILEPSHKHGLIGHGPRQNHLRAAPHATHSTNSGPSRNTPVRQHTPETASAQLFCGHTHTESCGHHLGRKAWPVRDPGSPRVQPETVPESARRRKTASSARCSARLDLRSSSQGSAGPGRLLAPSPGSGTAFDLF